MQTKFSFAIIAAVTCCFLASCHSDVDLYNIDSKAEMDLGVALPVGSLHATIGDFLGAGLNNFYVDSVDNQDVITWKDTFEIERNYHVDSLDLTKMITDKTLSLNVYDHLPAATQIGTDRRIVGTGDPITLRFELPLKLTGINKELGGERLDSAYIEMASFRSIINTRNGLPLQWKWVDKVTLELGAQIDRPKGNTMTVYRKGEVSNYGESIETEVDDFTLCLMKNRNLDPRNPSLYELDNVIDSCTFYINFTFTVPAGEVVLVPEDAGFDYNMKVEFIRYSAIWGKFTRSKDMYDESIVDLAENMGSLKFLEESNIPFADPKIDMHIFTQVAGAMKIDADYLFVEDIAGNKNYAEFQRGEQVYRNFIKQFEQGEYLDPITSPIGATTTNMLLQFSKDPKEGSINKLFHNMPQKMGYKFNVDFNYQTTPQIRITPNTGVRIQAVITLPLMFEQGLHLDYSDTIGGLDLSQVNIESLLGESKVIDEVKTSDVNVVIKAQNTIPLDIKAYFRCLNEAGDTIMDPADPTKPLRLFKEDTITLKAPTYTKEGASWHIQSPGETVIFAGLTKAELDLFPQIKQIKYFTSIDDSSLNGAYANGLSNLPLSNDQGVTLKIGLTAKVDAILDFGNTSGNNNTNTHK